MKLIPAQFDKNFYIAKETDPKYDDYNEKLIIFDEHQKIKKKHKYNKKKKK